ncbi:MAG: flagellar motor switch protein FliM [Deltaproteobacteria bacterium]|nr:flagellar motor switch protein FliM [Deltaproteobacteria bacterium]MBW2355062.1 flagellar motor switch protein FliM [Deltaproteobacteria bacterium]
MAQQILSQEEVDALLSSVASGEVELEPPEGVETKEAVADLPVYDLTAQNIMMREQFDVLDEVHDRFANSLRNSMGSTLGVSVEIELASTEMVKFGEFMEGLSGQTSFHTFRMEPLVGSALLAIEGSLVFFLIDCMFGGTGKGSIRQEREFTLLEQRIMRKFAGDVLKDLEKAWELVLPMRISIGKSETKQQFVRLVSPNDLVIVVMTVVSLDEFSANMLLCVPYLLLEPIREKLSYKNLRDAELGNDWIKQLKELLNETEVTVAAELGRASHTVRDILNLRRGDVIVLNTGPQDPVPVMVEKVPKFLGIAGVVAGNRAVQINSLVSRQNGAN